MGFARYGYITLFVIGLLLGSVNISGTAQVQAPVRLSAQAGFDGFFRPDQWLPIQIQAQNEGERIVGHLTVRPETSGRALNNAYSVPIDLPTGANKTVFLYVQLSEVGRTLLLELLDNEGVRVAERTIGLQAIRSRDRLHMVVSDSDASSLNLSAVTDGAYQALQGRWTAEALPPQVEGLRAVDSIWLYDVQSDQLTTAQFAALETWVALGGHLVIIGGSTGAQTASGLAALSAALPFTPTSNRNVDDLSTLSGFIGRDERLAGRSFVTTGTVEAGGRVLVTTADSEQSPLLIRGAWGAGSIDYLTVDPTLEPMRSWEGLPEFWLTLIATAPSRPGWQRGILDPQDAARALAIMPNVTLLPSVWSMLAFIAAYIALIGPINYLLLSQVRRRAWAWLTMPLFIVAFTLLAWNLGFNLRGNQLIVSRLYTVQAFAGVDTAYQEALIGVLSPRRDHYRISSPLDSTLQLLPSLREDSLFATRVNRSTAHVVEGEPFRVQDLAIDGGIFANFQMSRRIAAPAITGSATVSYLTGTERQIRGVIRNDSPITLDQPVILSRDQFYRLDAPLTPNSVHDFDTADFQAINDNADGVIPLASPLQFSRDLYPQGYNNSDFNSSMVGAWLLLDIPWRSSQRQNRVLALDSEDEETNRRRAFLRAFFRYQHASNGIGDDLYLIGWSNATQAQDVTVDEMRFRTVDTALYIVQLTTQIETHRSSESVTLTPDQWTWFVMDADMTHSVISGMHDITLINPTTVSIQLTPTAEAVLDTVTSMRIELDRGSAYGSRVTLSVWNWQAQRWDVAGEDHLERYAITPIEDYLGANNAVRVQLAIDEDLIGSAGTARLRNLRVIQTGTFQQ